MKVIVGLGNPGSRYSQTRHNVGYMVVDKLAKKEGLRFKKSTFYLSYLAEGIVSQKELLVVKPTTYMNNSGLALEKLVSRLKINLEEILVIHDDLDLSLGRILFRLKGSSGGHRGMASVIFHLGTQKIRRLRIGIGRPEGNSLDYVLAPFTCEEKKIMGDVLERAVSFCLDWMRYPPQFLMNKYH